jgi:hypothetical protein
MRSTLLLLIAMAYPTVADAGPCAIQSLTPHPLVHAQIAPGGGVVVGLIRGGFHTNSATSAVDKAWRFRDVNKLVEPAVQDIAPGLAVYTLPATGSPELALLDGDGTEIVAKVLRASKVTPVLAAPPLVSITYETHSASLGRRGIQTYTTGIADIGPDIPEGAAALIVYEVTKTGNVARSWASTMGVVREEASKTKTTKVSVYQSGTRCNPSLPGITAIAAGAKVVVAWLDTSGRLSPVSKPVTARATSVRK